MERAVGSILLYTCCVHWEMKKWVEMRRDLGPSLDKCRVIQSTENSGDQEEADGQRLVLCRTVPEDGTGLPTLSAKEVLLS